MSCDDVKLVHSRISGDSCVIRERARTQAKALQLLLQASKNWTAIYFRTQGKHRVLLVEKQSGLKLQWVSSGPQKVVCISLKCLGEQGRSLQDTILKISWRRNRKTGTCSVTRQPSHQPVRMSRASSLLIQSLWFLICCTLTCRCRCRRKQTNLMRHSRRLAWGKIAGSGRLVLS